MPNETNIGVATVVMPNLTPGPTTGVVMVADTATVTETRVAERRTTGGRRSNTPAKESRPSPVRSRWRKEASTPKNTRPSPMASLFRLIPFVVYKNTHIITDLPYHTYSN